METLADLLDDYHAWRDSLPASLADSASAIGWMSCCTCATPWIQLVAAELPAEGEGWGPLSPPAQPRRLLNPNWRPSEKNWLR